MCVFTRQLVWESTGENKNSFTDLSQRVVMGELSENVVVCILASSPLSVSPLKQEFINSNKLTRTIRGTLVEMIK